MLLLASTLLFISAVVYEADGEQKLECPYTPEKKNLNRVWCKREANNESCCTGFSFMPGSVYRKDPHMSVEDNGSVFTVTMTSLPQGDGVYWCGLSDTPNTIIKLAEKRFYNPMALFWTVLRWLLFVLLLLSVVLTHVFCSRKNG